MKFLAGLIVGVIVGAGGLFLVQRLRKPDAPRAIAALPVDAGAIDSPATKKRKGRTVASATASAPSPDAPAPILGASDLAMRAEGDALRPTSTLDLASDTEPRDLEQHEIDSAFASRADALISCITLARGSASLSGRVIAGVLVSPDGSVKQTRIEAPSYLLAQGLARCARPRLRELRFPATGKESVVTVPFDL